MQEPFSISCLFHHELIFSSADFEELNRDYEIHMSTGKLIRIGLGLVWGVLTGGFKMNSLKQFLSASGKAGQVKAHYQAYPASPVEFPAWVAKASLLWGEA